MDVSELFSLLIDLEWLGYTGHIDLRLDFHEGHVSKKAFEELKKATTTIREALEVTA